MKKQGFFESDPMYAIRSGIEAFDGVSRKESFIELTLPKTSSKIKQPMTRTNKSISEKLGDVDKDRLSENTEQINDLRNQCPWCIGRNEYCLSCGGTGMISKSTTSPSKLTTHTNWRKRTKKSLEENLLDGDKIQNGQMIASKDVLEWAQEYIEVEAERAIKDYILFGFGERCKEYVEGCPVCEEWKNHDDYIKRYETN